MIFSKLFNLKANWQNKESNVRIGAIKDELHLSSEQDIQVLKQLATQDENDLVRRSALIKLNDFSVWLNAYKQEKNSSVKHFAYENLINILASESSNILSEQDKLNFIREQITTSMAESVLEKAVDAKVVIALIERVNKPQTWLSLFAKKTDLTVRQYILSKLSDINTLEKLLKKTNDETVSLLIKEKLAILELEKQKPIKLLKDVQMVLSKLLALKEQKDYELVLEKRTSLNDEWNWLSQDLSCLTASDNEQILEKYATINAQLDKTFAQLKEQYEQAQIVKKLQEEKEQAIQNFKQQLVTNNQLLANAVFENQDINEVSLNDELEKTIVVIENSVLNTQEKADFTQQFKQQLTKLQQIPEIAESVTKATHLISKMSQQSPPESIEELPERFAYFNGWKSDWREIEAKVSGVIPKSIEEAKLQLEKQWNEALAPLQKEQKQLFSQAQKKVSELKRLIATGKYNASFGVFKRFKKAFEQLSEHHKYRLQRDFDQLSEKLAELSDWEHYIATPRKQQLLEEVQQLAEQPLDNPNDQANKVKQYRKTWNSLGHADENVDQSFNDAFNDALEKAFAPCRLWYAEQEKIREQHLTIRKQLVETAKTLAIAFEKDKQDAKKIEVNLNKLLLSWNEAGEVDRSVYQKLNKQFTDAVKPIKNFVFEYHQANAALKENLIKQVKTLQDNEDIFDTINIVKGLQSKWKLIGYAGAKLENKLWNEFRKVNDVIFMRRDEEKSKNQHDIDERVNQVTSMLAEFEQQIAIKNSISELQSIEDALNKLHVEQKQQRPVIKQVINQIATLCKQAQEKIKSLELETEKQSWINTFAVLEQLTSGKISVEQLTNVDVFTALPLTRKKRLLDALAKNNDGDRAVKTIELEVLAGIESPASDKAQRMQIQVSMMQEKMTSGQSIDLNNALLEWIAVAPLGEVDQEFLARIKPIFVKS